MSEETIILRPALIPMIFMAVVGAPFILLGVWVGIDASQNEGWTLITVASVAGAILLGGWCCLEIATVRIYLTPDDLLLRRFWRTRWSVRRVNALLKPGTVGDGGVLPGLRVYDVGQTRHVGEILSVQFRPTDLERLRLALQG